MFNINENELKAQMRKIIAARIRAAIKEELTGELDELDRQVRSIVRGYVAPKRAPLALTPPKGR